eukprot:CAMPEP_0176357504 /NCGR_PEP_ID=MMETSP0126-20121128/14818_1 /TAXON_ID=141414 ORGANISM="Strombidinopsis acuminatum, Strain SPMC142" /NCGR_SAMPLE_ID=MMETSP0126 /ASSEMBLY_ACC=CAM_ASM_000229 /LENGTH=115 /DNA_ID=CAMNT_0017711135 /DNA_START=80 /DNA_END=427 /DNA_ORIENTATION=-
MIGRGIQDVLPEAINTDFEFPIEIYPPLLIGKLNNETNLDRMLNQIGIPADEYICNLEVIKNSSSKKGVTKECKLVLFTKQMITIEERPNGPKIHHYPYMDVASCVAIVSHVGKT